MRIPLEGIRIEDFDRLLDIATNGARVFRTTGSGFCTIPLAVNNVPYDCERKGGPPSAPHGGVTAVLDASEALSHNARVIKAAVWDNVRVRGGPEAGRIGKVTEFLPGESGDGSDDIYVVESLTPGKLDARLLGVPTLGWEALRWPTEYLGVKAEDKVWQKLNERPEYDYPKLARRAVRLALNATEFERYPDFLTADDVVKLVIMPRCATSDGIGRSYCDVLGLGDDDSLVSPSDVVQLNSLSVPAKNSARTLDSTRTTVSSTHFVSFVYKYDFRTVVETLRDFCRGDDAPSDAAETYRFWFAATTMNQWAAAAGTLVTADWLRVFKTTIATIGHTLPIMMPWHAPINLTRVWCVYEVFESVNTHNRTESVRTTYLLPARERKNMLRALVAEFDSLAHAIANVALQDAEGTNPGRDLIIKMAADTRSDGVLSWNAINGAVCGALREWLAREGKAELERRTLASSDSLTPSSNSFAFAVGTTLKLTGLKSASMNGKTVVVVMVPRPDAAMGRVKVRLPSAKVVAVKAENLVFVKGDDGGSTGKVAPVDEGTLDLLLALGRLLREQGKLREAEVLCRRALGGSEATLGPTHPRTLRCVHSLGLLLQATGGLDAAEPLCRRALNGREATLGPLHRETLTSANNLGTLLLTQGRAGEAEVLYVKALEGREATLGPTHPDTLGSIGNLAELYHRRGMLSAAEPLYWRALKGSEEALGAMHPRTLIVVGNLAALLHAQRRLSDAEPLMRRDLEGSEVTLGPIHRNTLVSVGNFAEVLHKQGKLAEAESLKRRALAGCEATLGAEHVDTLISMGNLARLLADQGEVMEAMVLYTRALKGSEETLGRMHPNTLRAVGNLAGLMMALGKFERAEEYFAWALEGEEAAHGPRHIATLSCVNNLAGALREQGKLDDAAPLLHRAEEGLTALLGPVHPHTLSCVNSLADVLQLQGELDGAALLFYRLHEGRAATLGSTHPHAVATAYNLVGLLQRAGRLDEARALCESELARCRAALGRAHQDTVDFVEQLAGLG